jgi:hypothetical protein
VLTYKEELTHEMINIGLSMDYEYMLEYEGVIENFVSSYVV